MKMSFETTVGFSTRMLFLSLIGMISRTPLHALSLADSVVLAQAHLTLAPASHRSAEGWRKLPGIEGKAGGGC